MKPTQPTLLVSHGAAVYTASSTDPTHQRLAALAPRLLSNAPRAIVVCSAHCLTDGGWAVSSSAYPPLVHDHPVAELYAERYPAPGDPALAARLVEALSSRRLAARLEPQRGLDHGAWLPLRALVPQADIPVVMVSLNARASFEEHVSLGAVLADLRAEGVFVLASGGVTHNQAEFRRGFFSGAAPSQSPPPWSVGFDAWVANTLAISDPRARLESLARYGQHADYAPSHPTPDHFWPVLVAAGAAGADVGERVHAGFQHGLSMSAFLFGQLTG